MWKSPDNGVICLQMDNGFPVHPSDVLLLSLGSPAANARLVEELSAQTEFSVVSTDDAAKALAHLSVHRVSLVVVNAPGPTQTWRSFLRAVRCVDAHKDTPALVLIEAVDSGPVAHAVTEAGLGNVNVLVYPLEPSLLRAKLTTLLHLPAPAQGLSQNALERWQGSEANTSEVALHALESTSDLVFAFNPQWRFIYVNEAAEKRMTRPRESLLGRVLWDIYPGLIESPFGTAYLHAMTDRMPMQVEAFHAPFQAWFEVRAFPCATGIFAFIRDVTARKHADATLPGSRRGGNAADPVFHSHDSKVLNLAEIVPGVVETAHDSLRSIIRLSHCIEDHLGSKMTTESLRDMALLRGCVTHVKTLMDKLKQPCEAADHASP